ncbi:RagB/SusD family nutrient uptake outer membrane protein [Xylanibacter rodentium]|uniref:RagB/SusD family nutrient uptake outer membrane protein n=1 Tax=Xylanibacter rodentium TaxID=2736289 RepID=A0ABX2AWC8_9BACT|nr:RagB/SusD family nutrient uptake outer membrane protein [Xylanibacter rodentium]NPE10581.1 RagB/SusD family nutrient uptake outer membrane protein [Prevotella sp. PJ1A]NPE13970.1 RagB/SusD family nutrient uptake outer membrane protein [Xylanibacter rodentium]NPE38192.1 RagB/SusD family nutrient uptake outer membrane protein [Prevotella sp. PCJ2]
MKTRHIFLTGTMALSAFAVTSCSLDTESMTQQNDETAYRNLEAAELALVGCYDGWQRTISSEDVGIFMLAEFASDQAHGGLGLSDAKNNNAIDQFDLSVAPSYNNLFNADWTNYYNAIFRCNKIIANEDVTDWGTEADKGRVTGQARALRAILYFDLARMFGDVPLLTGPSKENIARTPAAEVYKVIFNDLKYAAANIPADAFPLSARESNDGHITKYAAEALLARAYLYYTGYYGTENEACTKQEAIDALNDVIQNGGYELEPDYADLFMPACTKAVGDTYAWETTYKGKYYNDGWKSDISKEVILNLKFGSTSDYDGNADGNVFQVYLGPRNVCATSVYIASGWGACPVTKAFVDKYKDDPRFSTCVWSCDEAGFKADLNDTYEYTGYYTRKYAPMCFADGTRQEVGFNLGIAHMNLTYYQDWTVMRYADVLLMHSELTETADGLNQVHRRTYPGETLAYSIENIRNERAIEFAFEGLHYWDLMRYEKDGAYAGRAIAAAQDGAPVLNGGMEATTRFDVNNFTAKKGLMQIPNTQITLSGGVLTQNEGW